MTDKEYYIDFWTPTLGAEEAARSWEAKQSQIRAQAPMVQGDIQPYISQIDGSLIESRSKHRAHLKRHNCIEIGNETNYVTKPRPLTPPPGLKQKLIEVANAKLRHR
jgi:hypothetical protein